MKTHGMFGADGYTPKLTHAVFVAQCGKKLTHSVRKEKGGI